MYVSSSFPITQPQPKSIATVADGVYENSVSKSSQTLGQICI